MFVFPFWSPLLIPEMRDHTAEQPGDLIKEHFASVRDHYVPGLAHFWR